jgi:hypothetical protein
LDDAVEPLGYKADYCIYTVIACIRIARVFKASLARFISTGLLLYPPNALLLLIIVFILNGWWKLEIGQIKPLI